MTETKSSAQWTRREFGRAVMAAGAVAAVPRWLEGEQTPSAAVSVTGADSLRAHAEARGLMYGTAVVPQLLDVDGLAAGRRRTDTRCWSRSRRISWSRKTR